MKSMYLGFALIAMMVFSVGSVWAQAAPNGAQCQEKLQAANNVLRTNAVTENLLESELNQKRKQVASLGLQLQEERQGHTETKKALAKLQGAAESTKKPVAPKE